MAFPFPSWGWERWKTFDVHGDASVRDRRSVVDAVIRSGTTLFDTSPMYGRAQDVLSLEWYGGRVDIYQIHNLVGWRESAWCRSRTTRRTA